MPVVVASASRSAHALISYVLDDKADQQDERYVMASGTGGLLVSVAKQQMRDVRKKWGKDRPSAFVQAYHVIESFAKNELSPEDPDSWMTAQKLGRALAEDRFPGRQVLVVTQRDGKTGCVHNHLVINSVEVKTGRSLDSSIVMHSRLVEAHERVLEAEGFEQRADLKQAFSDATERRERGEPSGLRRADSTQRSELREFQRYIMWEAENDIADEFGATRKPEPFSVTVLKTSIDQTLMDPATTDWASFVARGRLHGVDITQRGKKGRGISYGMLRQKPDGTVSEPSASDRRRCSSLGIDFEMDAVEKALARNSAAKQAQSVTVHAVAPAVEPQLASAQSEPAQPKQSAKERMLAALDQAEEEANANTQRMFADYLKAKAAAAEQQKPAAPMDQSEQDFTDSIADDEQLPYPHETEHQRAPEAVQTVLGTVEEPKIAEATLEPQTGAERLRKKTHGSNRRVDPLLVSRTANTATQETTPEQRRRKMKYPELFDDTEQALDPSQRSRALGD
jgi:hypothetical protein